MKSWVKLLLILILFAVISIGLFIVLKVLNIANLSMLKKIILQSGKCGKFVFVLIQIVMLVCFCFIPILNPALTLLGIVLYGSKTAYLLCLIAICFSSSILFILGDKFGEKLACKIIGKSELEKVQNVIDTKSKILLPLSFVIPGFPDEAFCIVAGMTKMKYLYFITVNILCHAIEIGLICFLGSSLIDWSNLTVFDWLVVVNIIIVDIYLLFKLEKFFDNKTKKNEINR